PHAAAAFPLLSHQRRMPEHVDITFRISRDRAAPIQSVSLVDQVAFGLERRASIVQPRIQHRRFAFGSAWFSGGRTVPGDVYAPASPNSQLCATNVADRDCAARPMVHPKRL